jgi:predicted nucleotidyltransferase
MIDRKQLAIDFAKSLNHPEIERIILFGSVARGEDTKDSDIDVLILTTDEK